MNVFAAAQEAAVTAPPSWGTLVAAVLGSSVLAGLLTATLGNVRAAAEARRDGYARAVKALIARAEYPYRIRRRVSDEATVLTALAERGHDIQEQLAACRTWVSAENREVGAIFEQTVQQLDAQLRPAAQDAWGQPPISAGTGMALGGWGPGDPWPHLQRLQHAIGFRFGWRRALPAWVIRRQVGPATIPPAPLPPS